MCLLPDLDEVDFSLEIPVSSNRLTSHLKPRQWPPVTTPREKKPDREIRVRLSVTETDFVVVEDLTSTASNAVVLKVRTSITICMSSIHDCSTTHISLPPSSLSPSFLPLSLPPSSLSLSLLPPSLPPSFLPLSLPPSSLSPSFLPLSLPPSSPSPSLPPSPPGHSNAKVQFSS